MAARVTHPCVFKHPMILDVNASLWAQSKETPFGTFERTWRRVHCAAVNPYGSETCPYKPEDCVLAYWKTASDALNAETSVIGLFRVLARRRGYDRADKKPLSRDRERPVSQTRRGPMVKAGDVLSQIVSGKRSNSPTGAGSGGPLGPRLATELSSLTECEESKERTESPGS